MAIILPLSEGLFQPMAQLAAVYNRKFPISALATGALFHPEFQGGA
jgi:hypothetical protein